MRSKVTFIKEFCAFFLGGAALILLGFLFSTQHYYLGILACGFSCLCALYLYFVRKKTMENTEYIFEKELDGINSYAVFVVHIDSCNEIASFYSKNIYQKMRKTLWNNLNSFITGKNYELYRFSNDRFVLLDANFKTDVIEGKKRKDYDEHEWFLFEKEKLEITLKELSSFLKDHDITENDELINQVCTIGACVPSQNALNKAIVALNMALDRRLDFMVFDETMSFNRKKIREAKARYKSIELSIKEKGTMPFFQPICDKDRNIIKYETLARIIENGGSVMLPGSFLEYARRTKKHEKLAKSIIAQALERVKEAPNVNISINLSLSDMVINSVGEFVYERIKELGVGAQITVEILENESIETANLADVNAYIKKLKELGVCFALDDFGTQFSNFALLMQIEPEYIKIDGSIIKNLSKSQKARKIVKTIVDIAKSLQIKTIAEYVSDKEIFDICAELEIDEFQGFYLSEPVANFLENSRIPEKI